MEGKRPRGVTIISILMIISGVASILIGLAILAGSNSLSLVAQGSDVGALAGVLMRVGGLTIALGIASLVIAWGLINAKRWAWILTVIISIISIITSNCRNSIRSAFSHNQLDHIRHNFVLFVQT
jgi:hypothetical protein